MNDPKSGLDIPFMANLSVMASETKQSW